VPVTTFSDLDCHLEETTGEILAVINGITWKVNQSVAYLSRECGAGHVTICKAVYHEFTESGFGKSYATDQYDVSIRKETPVFGNQPYSFTKRCRSIQEAAKFSESFSWCIEQVAGAIWRAPAHPDFANEFMPSGVIPKWSTVVDRVVITVCQGVPGCGRDYCSIDSAGLWTDKHRRELYATVKGTWREAAIKAMTLVNEEFSKRAE
jgi:hypothetical protein